MGRLLYFLLGLTLLSGCSTLSGTLEEVNHYRVSPEKVEEIRQLINAHPCPEGQKAVVAGTQFRTDGGMDLVVGCRP